MHKIQHPRQKTPENASRRGGSRVETWRGDDSSFRFHVPLIEPDRRISRIRLSDKDSCFRPREVSRSHTQPYQPEGLVQVLVGEPSQTRAPYFVLGAQPLTEPSSSG